MNSVERVKKICKERKIAISKLERDLGFSNGYIRKLKKGEFVSDRLEKIANYLNVSEEYIKHGIKGVPSDTFTQISPIESFSEKEKKLIADFRELNVQGQDYILQTMDMVKEKYKKPVNSSNMESIG